MRIVEYGHIKPRQVRCKRCGALLEYTDRDLISIIKRYILRCPVCGNGIVRDALGNELDKLEVDNQC